MSARGFALAALAALALVCCDRDPAPASRGGPRPDCRITDVVDGDTVHIRCAGGPRQSARLMGFDTPETFRPGCRAERAHGALATAFLTRRIAQAQEIEFSTHGRDRYDRVLMRLILDGTDVADTMIDAGLALPYDGGRREHWCDILPHA